MASNMNLSIRISTFPLFTIVKLDRDMEQWEIGCHRSSLWKKVVEMCVKGGTRNSGPYVLPTSHPCNHQSEVVRVRSLCGAYYSRHRPMLSNWHYVVDTDLTLLGVAWLSSLLSHFPRGNHSLSLRFNYSKCWLFMIPQEKCWFLRVPRHLTQTDNLQYVGWECTKYN